MSGFFSSSVYYGRHNLFGECISGNGLNSQSKAIHMYVLNASVIEALVELSVSIRNRYIINA